MALFSRKELTPQPVQRAGIALKCDHCGHDRFLHGRVQLAMYNGDLGWRGADCYSCERCERLHWFRHTGDKDGE